MRGRHFGATTGTVSVDYDGGTTGGTITNCAHLRSAAASTTVENFQFLAAAGLNLQACNTQSIDATCVPGTAGCGWRDGNVVTYTHATWGDPPTNAAAILLANYDHVYASTFGLLEAGIPSTAGFSMAFTDPFAVLEYLPAIGPIGPLDGDLLNPTSSASGTFGGEVVALKLNVDFSAAGVTLGNASLPFGTLTLCNVTALPNLNGLSVGAFLDLDNTLLGGGSGIILPSGRVVISSISDVFPVTQALNAAFSGGTPSTFAQDHLFNGACP